VTYNVIADEIAMARVAEQPEALREAFAGLLFDLMTDPWSDSRPYDENDPGDPMRLKSFGPLRYPSAHYWIDADRRTVRVLDILENA
jgi:hypothetical protein